MGFHTQSTLLAPSAEKISWTWRQACTYCAARFPFTPGDHGFQSPFISGANRSMIGPPQAAISRAQRAIKASWAPPIRVAKE